MKWKQSLPHLILAAALVALIAYVHLFFTTEMEQQQPIKIGLIEADVPDSPAGMDAIDRLHAKGANIIVTATYGYGGLFQDAGQKYPDTNFYTIIPSNYAGNVRTYFVRIYQLRYLQGILAGLKTKTGQIGFISYDCTPDNVQELDAFALGVRRVNPEAHVVAAFQPLEVGTIHRRCDAPPKDGLVRRGGDPL